MSRICLSLSSYSWDSQSSDRIFVLHLKSSAVPNHHGMENLLFPRHHPPPPPLQPLHLLPHLHPRTITEYRHIKAEKIKQSRQKRTWWGLSLPQKTRVRCSSRCFGSPIGTSDQFDNRSHTSQELAVFVLLASSVRTDCERCSYCLLPVFVLIRTESTMFVLLARSVRTLVC
jgi:hypothetical protein